jgi:hypothetical protein
MQIFLIHVPLCDNGPLQDFLLILSAIANLAAVAAYYTNTLTHADLNEEVYIELTK